MIDIQGVRERSVAGPTGTVDLSALSLDELYSLLNRILTDGSRIKLHISKAMEYRSKTGAFADPEWYARAKFASRAVKRETQIVQQEIARRKASHRRDRHASVCEAFCTVAKQTLDSSVFSRIMDEAKAIYSQEKDKESS